MTPCNPPRILGCIVSQVASTTSTDREIWSGETLDSPGMGSAGSKGITKASKLHHLLNAGDLGKAFDESASIKQELADMNPAEAASCIRVLRQMVKEHSSKLLDAFLGEGYDPASLHPGSMLLPPVVAGGGTHSPDGAGEMKAVVDVYATKGLAVPITRLALDCFVCLFLDFQSYL